MPVLVLMVISPKVAAILSYVAVFWLGFWSGRSLVKKVDISPSEIREGFAGIFVFIFVFATVVFGIIAALTLAAEGLEALSHFWRM